jgi:hypothetical protein
MLMTGQEVDVAQQMAMGGDAVRTHLSLEKDAPNARVIQRHGRIEGRLYYANSTINTCGFDLR